MKFVPRAIEGNVNVSSVSPVKDFFELLFKILGLLLFIYIVLGFVVDYIAPRLSIEAELKLGKIFSASFNEAKPSAAENKIQIILDSLIRCSRDLPKFDYKIHIKESRQVNAFAFPAGIIVVNSALLGKVKSENELGMVLAHELGHYVHRDHLRGLGRSFVFLLLSSVVFGADSPVSKFIMNSLNNAEMRFSQAQEKAADTYALDLLYRTYGHIAGATDFFEKMAPRQAFGRFFYLFSSHPYTKDRILAIKERILKNGYESGKRIPLDCFPAGASSEKEKN